MTSNDKTTVLNTDTVLTTAKTSLNPKKMAVLGGVILAGGVSVAAYSYRNANGEVVPAEVVETAHNEAIKIQRNEQGQISSIVVDEDNDGKDDLRFENPQKINAIPPKEGELETATKVNDTMSFSQAFATARTEVGEGGVFEWHGKLYGTYYKEEWDEMTPEQKTEYGQNVNEYIAENPIPEYHAPTQTTTDTPTDNTVTTASNNTPPETTTATTTTPTTTVANPVATNQNPADNSANDVVLMGEVDIDGDGVVDGVAFDTNNNNVADVIKLDMNHNGVVDALVVNENEDNVIDAIYVDQNEDGVVDAIVDANGNPINQDELPPDNDNNQDLAVNQGDFQDDADVSEWV